MARNPYDRRSEPRDEAAGMAWADGLFHGVGVAQRDSPVAFRDMEALVHSAYRRGASEAQADHEAALRNAQREAWEQGHATGADDGREEMLRRIDERFGAELRVAIKASEELVARFAADERKASKRDFVERLSRHVSLLDRLRDAHHAKFEGMPF